MTLRSRKPRPLTREEKTFRDDRLFVIATEDTHAPDQYFRVFGNSRIQVRILPTERGSGLSSPAHVLERLDGFQAEFEWHEDDEFWLMLDTDHWVEASHIAGLTRVCAEAVEKGFQLAHSNPCFEIWLLLHFAGPDTGEQFGKCKDVELRLNDILGGYSKRRIGPDRFTPEAIEMAVARAEKLDGAPDDRWPRKTGSHVYRVVKKLLQG